MTTLNLYPPQGQTVYDETGVVVPITGITITLTAYYLAAVRAGNLLTYDPLNNTVQTTETLANSQQSGLYATDLTARSGLADRSITCIDNYSSTLPGGSGIFSWDASSTSSPNLGTIFGNGTTGRWFRKYDDDVNIRWFGCKGDGSTSDKAAIQSCLDLGETVKIPRGTYLIGSTLNLTIPQSVIGEGPHKSVIKPSGLSTSTDNLYYQPSTSLQANLYTFSNFGLLNPTNGARTGRHGLHIDTTDARSVGQLAIHRIHFGSVDSDNRFGIYHGNDPAINVNGGLYCSTISECSIQAGIKLVSTGDSNNIQRNIISGRNIGVHASLAPGASCLSIENNNITSDGGSIRIDSGARFRIVGNNTENYNAGALSKNGGAGGVYVSGSVVGVYGYYEIYGGVIKENFFAVYGASDADCFIRLAYCRGTLIENNVFAAEPAGFTAIRIDATCKDVRIGKNAYNANCTTKVLDLGEGTMGVVKTPTLSNSWTAHANHEIKYIKDLTGIVHFEGTISGGTTTAGIQLFTMPVGFRPSAIVRAPAYWVNSTPTHAITEITIETGGEVRIAGATTSHQYVSFSMSYPASLIGDASTYE